MLFSDLTDAFKHKRGTAGFADTPTQQQPAGSGHVTVLAATTHALCCSHTDGGAATWGQAPRSRRDWGTGSPQMLLCRDFDQSARGKQGPALIPKCTAVTIKVCFGVICRGPNIEPRSHTLSVYQLVQNVCLSGIRQPCVKNSLQFPAPADLSCYFRTAGRHASLTWPAGGRHHHAEMGTC